MKIYSNHEKYKPFILQKYELASSPNQAQVLLLVKDGSDLKPYLNGVLPIVIDAGEYDSEAEQIISLAAAKGVPEENVLICMEGGMIPFAEIETVLQRISQFDPSAENGDKQDTVDRFTGSAEIPPSQENILGGDRLVAVKEPEVFEPPSTSPFKALAVLGFRGGMGKSLIASALCGTYAGFGEKIALVDLCKPALARYYMGLPNLIEDVQCYLAQTKWGDILIPKPNCKNELLSRLSGYKRVVFDCPSYIPEEWQAEILSSTQILVVDHDIRSLEVSKENIRQYRLKDHLLIINKVPPINLGAYSYVVTSVLEKDPIMEIPLDESCGAYIAQYGPVIDDHGSSVLALKIGELASIINHEMEDR